MEDRAVANLPHGACGRPGAGPEAWGQALALPGHSEQMLWHSSAPSVAVPQERPQTGDLQWWWGEGATVINWVEVSFHGKEERRL